MTTVTVGDIVCGSIIDYRKTLKYRVIMVYIFYTLRILGAALVKVGSIIGSTVGCTICCPVSGAAVGGVGWIWSGFRMVDKPVFVILQPQVH